MTQKQTTATRIKLLSQGKAKDMYTSDQPGQLIMVFRDDMTAFNGEKKEAFEKCLADYKRTIWKELRKAERKEKLEKLENVQIRNDGMV